MNLVTPPTDDMQVLPIAQQLRTPLAVLSSAAQLLLAHPLPPEMERECLETIHRQTARMADILDRLVEREQQ